MSPSMPLWSLIFGYGWTLVPTTGQWCQRVDSGANERMTSVGTLNVIVGPKFPGRLATSARVLGDARGTRHDFSQIVLIPVDHAAYAGPSLAVFFKLGCFCTERGLGPQRTCGMLGVIVSQHFPEEHRLGQTPSFFSKRPARFFVLPRCASTRRITLLRHDHFSLFFARLFLYRA